MSHRQTFEKIRAYWKTGTWLAVDFEAWEMDHHVITEFGWSYVRWKENEETAKTGHFLVKENMLYRNSKYVPDNSGVRTFSPGPPPSSFIDSRNDLST